MESGNIFETLSPSEVEQRINKFWKFQQGFPLPLWRMKCAQCGSYEIILRYYHYHKRKAKANPFRCDVAMKCCCCSHAFVFGLVVSKEIYALRQGRRYERAEAKAILNHE